MRVAFIHPFLYRYPRGIERFTFNIANALAHRDVVVDLLTWQWPNPVQIDTLNPSVRVRNMPTSRFYAAKVVIPFYFGQLKRQRYDFVWIYFAGYGEAEALALAHQQPFGIIFHYPYDQVPHRYKEFHRFDTAGRARLIVSVSGFVADGVRKVFGRESSVIHHGVDTERFRPDPVMRSALRQRLGLDTDQPLLVTTAALEARKGVQWVLQALPVVLRYHPTAMYIVVGDGPHRRELELLTDSLGVREHVRFIGAQDDVAPYLQAADLSLILSRGEASSLAALESLSCGLPVIAADQRPFDELIRPEYGVLVGEEDPLRVSQAISGLLSSPEKLHAFGVQGRQQVVGTFNWGWAAEQYLRLMTLDPTHSAPIRAAALISGPAEVPGARGEE